VYIPLSITLVVSNYFENLTRSSIARIGGAEAQYSSDASSDISGQVPR